MKKRFTVKASTAGKQSRITAASDKPYEVSLTMSPWEFEKWCEQLCDEIIENYDHDIDIHDAFNDVMDCELTYYDDCMGLIHGAQYYEWDDREIGSIQELAYKAVETAFYDSGLWNRLEEAWESDGSAEEEE